MQNKSKNKAVGASPTKKVEREFSFPTHNKVIKASSPEEAREKLAAELKGDEDK